MVEMLQEEYEMDIIGGNASGGNMKLDIIGKMLQVEYEIGYHWRECFGNMKLDIIGGSLGEI
jgi:hypothetical protein